MSEATAQIVDEEVAEILNKAYADTKLLLQNKMESLHLLAQALLERETLTGEEIKIVLEGGTLPEIPAPFVDTNQPRTSVPLSGTPTTD